MGWWSPATEPPALAGQPALFSLGAGSLDRLQDQPLGVIGVAPPLHLRPLARLEVLVVGEEVLDLLGDDRRQVVVTGNLAVIWKRPVGRHADQLFVTAL